MRQNCNRLSFFANLSLFRHILPKYPHCGVFYAKIEDENEKGFGKGWMCMYHLFLSLQFIGIIALIIEIFYVSRQHSSKLQVSLVLLLYSSLFNIVGYTMEMMARDQTLAMQATKFAYVGKPFVVFFMYLFITDYCEIVVPKFRRNLFFGICIFIMTLVFTNPYHKLYYSSVSYTQDGLFPHLILKHGILYNLYTAFIGYYFIVMVLLCIEKYRQTRSEIVRKQVLTMLAMVLLSCCCLVLFLLRLTNGYDSTALAYLAAALLFERLLRKYRLFDTLSLAQEEAVDHMANGLIVIGVYGEMIYSNAEADRILKYLTSRRQQEDLEYLKQLAQKGEYLFVDEDEASGHVHEIQNEKCVYEIALHNVSRGETHYGQTLTITEITDRYYYTERLQHELKHKTKEIVQIQRDIIGSFAAMIEARDGITGLHIKNTGNLVRVLVDVMAQDERYKGIITQEYADMVAAAARLHDIGKIAIPDRILQKEGKLTDEEFAIMKTHPEEGAKILKGTLKDLENDTYCEIAYDMALYHHEKYDGNGYPTGIRGEEIPLSARIMAVADVYDALRSKRHYKEGFTKEKSMAIMRESRGSHFDPVIDDIFLAHIDEMEAVLDTGSVGQSEA